MGGFVSIPGGATSSYQNFYGLKTSNDLGRLYVQVVDDGSKILLPQSDVNSNGVRVRKPGEYKEWIFTPELLTFQWDTENPTHLLVEVG
jgi:hypothetical protein